MSIYHLTVVCGAVSGRLDFNSVPQRNELVAVHSDGSSTLAQQDQCRLPG